MRWGRSRPPARWCAGAADVLALLRSALVIPVASSRRHRRRTRATGLTYSVGLATFLRGGALGV